MKKIFLIISLAFVSMFSYSQVMTTDEMYLLLKESETLLNQNYPQMLDEITRIDMVVASKPKTIEYKYTIVSNYTYAPETIESIKKIMIKSHINNINSDKMAILRDNNVTFIYTYRDKFGNLLFTIKLTPDMYKNKEKLISM